MRSYSLRVLLLLIVACINIPGCKNSVEPIANSGGGSLAGTVKAFGITSAQEDNPSGIQVELQATVYKTIADSLGNFRIDNIPAGVYNIIFSKPGFNSMVYPVHHLIGAGTDIINDAFLIKESTDSISLKIIPVFTVSVTKYIHIIDTLIKVDLGGGLDTIVRSFDTVIVTYDTVKKPTTLVVNCILSGNSGPKDIFVYSSLDSALYPNTICDVPGNYTLDEWLDIHRSDTSYHTAFQVPRIANGIFADTLSSDVKERKPFSFESGQVIYVYAVGHSNTDGLPEIKGQYEHYSTTPYGPKVVRYKYVVP